MNALHIELTRSWSVELSRRRSDIGVTFARIGADLGVQASTVYRWLRDEQVPGWAVRTIARHLCLSPDRVLERCELSRLRCVDGGKSGTATTTTAAPSE